MKHTRTTTKKIKFKKKYSAVWMILSCLLVANVLLGISFSASGADLAVHEKKAKEYEKENAKISQEVVQSMSLALVEEKAEEMGYIKPNTIVYVGKDKPVAVAK